MTEVLFTFDKHKNSKPRTLILDIDETLAHSWENPNFVQNYEIYTNPAILREFHPIGCPSISYSMTLDISGNKNMIWGLYRPYLHEFLTFANNYFDNMIVWSAGIAVYVEEIVKQMFDEAGLNSPKLTFSRNRCAKYQDLYHKPISEIDSELSSRYYESFKIDPKFTLILDDKQHTFMNNANNGVLCPIYHPGKNRTNRIPTLNDLLDRSITLYINSKNGWRPDLVKNSNDLRDLDKLKYFCDI